MEESLVPRVSVPMVAKQEWRYSAPMMTKHQWRYLDEFLVDATMSTVAIGATLKPFTSHTKS